MSDATVFVVDDDAAVRSALVTLLNAADYRAQAFETAESFVAHFDDERPGCLIVDIQMPGLSGLELQQRLNASDAGLPLIILTGHGDVPAAVKALKDGAVDFLEKPVDGDTLLSAVERALQQDQTARTKRASASQIRTRLATLTPREQEVMNNVCEGLANKVIAIELGISERTVELHRARVMKKLGVRSVAELVRLATDIHT